METEQLEPFVRLDLFDKYDIDTKTNIIEYIKQLNLIEKKALMIGKKHLGSSFNILKSNGYIAWNKNKK